MTRLTILTFLFLCALAPSGLAQGEDETAPTPTTTALDVVWDEREIPTTPAEAAAQLKAVEAALAAVSRDENAALHAQLSAQKQALEALGQWFEEKPLEERKAELGQRRTELEGQKKQLAGELAKEFPIGSGAVDDETWNSAESRKIEAKTAWNSASTRAQSAGQRRSIIGDRATNLEAQLRTLQAEETAAESERVTKNDPTVAVAERVLATEKAWALRLRVHIAQSQLSRLKKQQALGLPDLEFTVADLEKEIAGQRKRLADEAHDRLAEQRKQWTEQEARDARRNVESIKEKLAQGAQHEKPFLELRLRELDLETSRLEWQSRLEQRRQRGPVRRALDRARETEIEIQREERGEQILPRDADALRKRVAEAKADLRIARAKRTEMRDERVLIQAARDDAPAISQADDRIAEARKLWVEAGGERARHPISEEEWAKLGQDYKKRVDETQRVLDNYLDAVNELDGEAQELAEMSGGNLAVLQDRLVWTRESSNISVESVQQAADDAGQAFDRLGELPGRIWSYIREFVAAERTKAVVGGVLTVVMLLFLLLAHRKLPKSYSYFDERTGVAHAIGTVLRRTDFTFTVAVVFVGIPWGIGLARGAIVAVAAVFASPFIYRLGRVLLDVLFAPESEADRIIRIEDRLANLFHVTGKILLNISLMFVPVGLLMEYAGYMEQNPGFVSLWWLVFSVLKLLVLLFTVFRPAVVGRLIRGEGVVAVSVKSWILILYPLIVGAVLFLFVLSMLRYDEAEQYFRGLILKSAGMLLGSYVLYRVSLRQLLRGRKIEAVGSSDDFENEEDYLRAGRRHFSDATTRWVLRLVFMVPAAFLLVRTWEGVRFGLAEDPQADGVTVQSVFWSFVALFATAVIARTVKSGLTFMVLPRSDLDRGMRYTVVTVATYVLWAFGLIIALKLLRVKGDQIAMVVSALMFGLGFGLQSIVKNFVSGLILLAERPVKVGDRVDVSGGSGVVEKITLRATTVMTWEGVGIVIPNEEMIGGTLTNQSLGQPRLRTDLAFGVAYGTDIQAVRELVMEVVKAHGLVLRRPGPEVFFMGFGDSSLDFEVRYWTVLTTHRLRVVSDLRFAMEAAFARENIEIPFPQRDLNLRTVDPEAGAALSGRAALPPEPEPEPDDSDRSRQAEES